MSESSANRLRTVCAAIVILAFIGAGSAAARVAKPSGQNIAPPPFSHVFIVIFENHPYSTVVGASDMPYINSLISSYGLAANYYANAHPSIGNYFMLTTGKIITRNDNFNGVVKANNVVRVLKANNLTWKGYFENFANSTLPETAPYLKHHNPFAFFSDVLDDPSEAANMVDLSQLYTDLSNNSVPNYSFIVPNEYHQGHDPDTTGGLCANSDRMAEVDCFLQNDISPVVDYVTNQGGLLIITWDEGDGADHKHGGGHIATVLVSNLSKAGYQSTRLYQHPSSLRLMLESLGVTKLPGAAQRAPEMGEFFNQ
jgi:acid phosphatase